MLFRFQGVLAPDGDYQGTVIKTGAGQVAQFQFTTTAAGVFDVPGIDIPAGLGEQVSLVIEYQLLSGGPYTDQGSVVPNPKAGDTVVVLVDNPVPTVVLTNHQVTPE